MPYKRAKRYYTQKFRECWLSDPVMKEWLTRHPDDPNRAYCKICKFPLESKKCNLLKHPLTDKHRECSGEYDPFAYQKPSLKFSDSGTKIYQQKFRESWLREDCFKDWLMKDPENITRAYCKICNRTLESKRACLFRHASSFAHLKAKAFMESDVNGGTKDDFKNILILNSGDAVSDGSKSQVDPLIYGNTLEELNLDLPVAKGYYSLESVINSNSLAQLMDRLLRYVKRNVKKVSNVFIQQEHQQKFIRRLAKDLMQWTIATESKEDSPRGEGGKTQKVTEVTLEKLEESMFQNQPSSTSGLKNESGDHDYLAPVSVANHLLSTSTNNVTSQSQARSDLSSQARSDLSKYIKRKRGGSRKRFTDEELKARKQARNRARYEMKSAEIQDLKAQGIRPHGCTVCGMRFYQKGTLRIHEKIHTGVKDFKCKYCGKAFLQYTTCKQHEIIHTNERPFVCEICGKAYQRSCSLHDHIRVHLGIKPHKCQYCGQAFRRRYHLKVHERTHTGEKPICCDICGQSFANPGTFYTHRKRHGVVGHVTNDVAARVIAQVPSAITKADVGDAESVSQMLIMQNIDTQQVVKGEVEASDALVALGQDVINLNTL